MEAMGVNNALREAGAQHDDLVWIADYEFHFNDERGGYGDNGVP